MGAIWIVSSVQRSDSMTVLTRAVFSSFFILVKNFLAPSGRFCLVCLGVSAFVFVL